MTFVRARDKGLITKQDAAQMVGMDDTTFGDWINRGRIDAPTHQFRDRKYYVRQDIPKLKRQAEKKYRRNAPATVYDGFYNQKQAAEELGMPHVTLTLWIYKGWTDGPTHKLDHTRLRYFDKSDLDRIRLDRADYFEMKKRQKRASR